MNEMRCKVERKASGIFRNSPAADVVDPLAIAALLGVEEKVRRPVDVADLFQLVNYLRLDVARLKYSE